MAEYTKKTGEARSAQLGSCSPYKPSKEHERETASGASFSPGRTNPGTASEAHQEPLRLRRCIEVKSVGVVAAEKAIFARAADQHIKAVSAAQIVVAAAADQIVVAAKPGEDVGATTTRQVMSRREINCARNSKNEIAPYQVRSGEVPHDLKISNFIAINIALDDVVGLAKLAAAATERCRTDEDKGLIACEALPGIDGGEIDPGPPCSPWGTYRRASDRVWLGGIVRRDGILKIKDLALALIFERFGIYVEL